MCTCSPESQWYAGLSKGKCAQQVKGGDYPLLLHSHETLPGVLHPAMESPVQERHEPVEAGPEESYENGQRAGTPLL